jgi:hypothetical protein
MKRTTVFLFALLCGCQSHRAPTTAAPPTTRPSLPTTMQISLTAHPVQPADPRDPPPELTLLIHLDVYQLDLPMGAVSRNEALWKRVDEQAVGGGEGTTDLLFKNGLRCGVAPRSEWSFFREFMSNQPGRMRQTKVNGTHGDAVTLEMDKPVDHEDVFYFDASNQMIGRTFDSCVNGVSLSFEPTPRKQGSVRLAIAPTILGERRQLEFTPANQEYESPFAEVTRLYDLNLRVDVADDSFLVVAPSEDASRTTSIGARFFTTEDKAERLERVLLIVPSFLRLDGKPVTYTETMARQ